MRIFKIIEKSTLTPCSAPHACRALPAAPAVPPVSIPMQYRRKPGASRCVRACVARNPRFSYFQKGFSLTHQLLVRRQSWTDSGGSARHAAWRDYLWHSSEAISGADGPGGADVPALGSRLYDPQTCYILISDFVEVDFPVTPRADTSAPPGPSAPDIASWECY